MIDSRLERCLRVKRDQQFRPKRIFRGAVIFMRLPIRTVFVLQYIEEYKKSQDNLSMTDLREEINIAKLGNN